MASSPHQLIESASSAWTEPKGLVAAIVLWVVIFGGFLTASGLGATATLASVTIGAIFISILWWYPNRLRKTKRNKIGFAVSLHCDKDLQTEIHDDFVTTLRRLVLGGQSAKAFDFIEIPPRVAAKTLDIDAAQRLRLRIRCHFLLYGRVRKRQIGDATRYFLELDGIVAHGTIKPELQAKFKAEFSELLPRRLEIDDSASFVALEFTSRVANAVSKYIIGVAMTLSGFYDEAEAMLLESNALAQQVKPKLPPIEKILERAPLVLSTINLIRGDAYYARWRDHGHHDDDLENLNTALGNVTHTSLMSLTLNAISVFLVERNTHEARKLLYQVLKVNRDGAWEYNQGFLFAYDGNLKKAKQHFVRGAQARFPTEKTIAELELFMCWVLEQEPEKHQLHFALGLLNQHLKSDYARAIDDFQEFLDRSKTGQFDREQGLAKMWIKHLKSRI